MKRTPSRGFWAIVGLVAVIGLAGCGQRAAAPKKPAHSPQYGQIRRPRHQTNRSRSGAPAPPASSTVGSVSLGAKVFAATCQSCHGRQGLGTKAAPRLWGAQSVIQRFGTERALDAFIAHNMPASNPGSLSASESANASAYVWHLVHQKASPKAPHAKA